MVTSLVTLVLVGIDGKRIRDGVGAYGFQVLLDERLAPSSPAGRTARLLALTTTLGSRQTDYEHLHRCL
jgi:hypothetical protein